MKKTVVTFVICLLALCITACNNTNRSNAAFGNTMEFASSEEMLKHLEGMWLVSDNTEENSYYIFRDGQIYIVTDTMYSAQVENMLNSALQNGGLEGLYIQTFDNISNRMYLSDISIAPNPISLFPQNGEIKLYEGNYDEKNIIITEESVLLVTGDTKSSTVMTKLSDTADFSTDYFEPLFNQVLDSYEIPTKRFLIDTIEYGEMVKTTIPQFDWWSLTWSDDDFKVYAPDEALTPVAGSSLSIAKESLTFVYKISVSTGFVGKDHNQSRLITYSPEEGSIEIIETNNPSMNLYSLITCGIYAVRNVPGAYTDPEELFNDMVAHGKRDSSDYSENISMAVNGITYEFYSTTDGRTLGRFTIKADGTIPLDAILEGATENTETVTTPTQSGDLSQLLDGSKNWIGKWKAADGWEYNVYFVFQEDGTSYFALGNETELYGAGKGTYEVSNGSKLSVKIMIAGVEKAATYSFDPNTFSLTVTSNKGLVAENGETIYLQENTVNVTEQVKGWGERYAEGTSNSGNTVNEGNTSNGGGFSNGGNTSNGGNDTVTQPPVTQQPAVCSHDYMDATCTTPKTCTLCGQTSGSALGHTYSAATCTAPQTCNTCGATSGSVAGHRWESATCTHPETCSVCNHTQGDALGHNMGLTKCSRCDYTDYSAIAKSYSKVTAYDSKTGEDLEVTNVSVSNTGVLSFTFNGNSYSITIKERVYDSMTYFDCYQNGSKLSKAECRIGDASYYNMLHFECDGIDGHHLYFCTEKQ